MSAHFGTKWVKKTRKNHICAWCGTRVMAGSVASYQAGVFDGDFFSGHYHPECQAAMDAAFNDREHRETRRYIEEGFMPGDFERGRINGDEAGPRFLDTYRGDYATIGEHKAKPVRAAMKGAQ